ncbi:7854_t:CDS:2, partial [Dentiscutata erythropus]
QLKQNNNENLYIGQSIKDYITNYYNANEAIYINSIQLSQEYQVINLSDYNISSPVQKLLTKTNRQLLKTIWNLVAIEKRFQDYLAEEIE